MLTFSSPSLQGSSDAPTIPAPLAIPPSRARRQLAARLAEKQAAAKASESSQSAHASSSSGLIEDDSSHLADRIRAQAEAEGMYEHGSDEEDENYEGANEKDHESQMTDNGMHPAPLKRQMTTEAESRRPLDVDDDEDDDDDERLESTGKSNASNRAGGLASGSGSGGLARNIQWGEDSDSDDDEVCLVCVGECVFCV